MRRLWAVTVVTASTRGRLVLAEGKACGSAAGRWKSSSVSEEFTGISVS